MRVGSEVQVVRPNIHVLPERGGWIVKPEGATSAVSTHRNQQEAIEAARRLAQRSRAALIIHELDGRTRKEGGSGELPPK